MQPRVSVHTRLPSSETHTRNNDVYYWKIYFTNYSKNGTPATICINDGCFQFNWCSKHFISKHIHFYLFILAQEKNRKVKTDALTEHADLLFDCHILLGDLIRAFVKVIGTCVFPATHNVCSENEPWNSCNKLLCYLKVCRKLDLPAFFFFYSAPSLKYQKSCCRLYTNTFLKMSSTIYHELLSTALSVVWLTLQCCFSISVPTPINNIYPKHLPRVQSVYRRVNRTTVHT